LVPDEGEGIVENQGMKGWIDTHAHLDFPEFEQDLEGVLSRAQSAGVEKIISIGTCLESSRAALLLAQRYPQIYAVVGIHPCDVWEESPQSLAQLPELLTHPRVAAVGECGLDYHHLPPRLEQENDQSYHIRWSEMKLKQAAFFRQQLEWAAEHSLNVVIHQRDSWEDTLSILKEFSGRLQAVFHCFGGSQDQAKEVLSLGHLVSFTGILTFKKADLVRETARSLPSGRFMIETDCPYLAPVPNRGRRCEPSDVSHVAITLARERKISPEALAEELWETSHSFFRL
jgi:TatD DNase family protein